MRCHDPKSGFKLDVKVCHGKDNCQEFSPHFDTDGSLCCWIPVNAGEDLSVYVCLQGPLKLGHLDLIVDGVLRNSKAITSSMGKLTTRKEKFLAAYKKSDGNITSCAMRVKDLGDTSGSDSDKAFLHAVGTIELRVALTDNVERTHDLTRDLGTFEDTASWRDAEVGVGHSRIAPTHEIELVNQDVVPAKTRKTLLHNHLKKDKGRPGDKPWVVFKFFYRSGDALGLNVVQSNVYSHNVSACQATSDSSESETDTDSDTDTGTDTETGRDASNDGDPASTAPDPTDVTENGMIKEAADAEEPIVPSSSPGPRALSQPPVPSSPTFPSSPPSSKAPPLLMENDNATAPNTYVSGDWKPLADSAAPVALNKRPYSASAVSPAAPAIPKRRPHSAAAVQPDTTATAAKRPHSASPARRSISVAMSSTPSSSAKRVCRERSETSTQLRAKLEEEARARDGSQTRLSEALEKTKGARAELEAAQKAAEGNETALNLEKKEGRLEQKDAELTAARKRVVGARKEAQEANTTAEEGGTRREKEMEALKATFPSMENPRLKAFFAALDRIHSAAEIAERKTATVAIEHVEVLEELAEVIDKTAKDLEAEMEEAEDIEMFEKY